MDGVLVDSGELHFQAWSQTLAEAGIPFSRESFRKTFGMNNTGIMTFLLGKPPDPSLLSYISDRKEGFFRQAIHGQVRPMPGVLTWLKRLQRLGYLQAVASSAPQANIDALVDEMQVRAYFAAIVSAYDMPGKPDPAVFLEAARRLDLSPERCIVVEDALSGVAAAHHAGMKCIAVTTTNPRQDLAEADVTVDSLVELQLEDFRR
jgi:HAD superfamily hydrolase (TIGR01509 family)